jgi:hypothetical protein
VETNFITHSIASIGTGWLLMENIADPKVWSEFGLGGLVILALFVFIYYVTKQAREERKEWLLAYKEHTVLYDARQGETNAVISNLTQVIQNKLQEQWNGEERRRNGREAKL